ncbi:MAG: 2-oxoacid:acceptor oxidoreductase family protein [Candidatus Aenigmatarchaeota archaeon]|nr:2-oxoacid:acceptor oxidoreductase family protein [Candidatus Aenigmarchaeota archaeon]
MKYNILIAGIGGEGVLTSGVVIARAAEFEEKYVMGLQLHGLSQRGGSIPVFVRFGNVHSPTIPRGEADLIIATEPSEALRYAKYGSKEKTVFIIDNNPVKSPYSNILNEHYPSEEEIKEMLKEFSKKIYFVNLSKNCENKFGNPIYGNIALVGFAFSLGLIPLKKENIIKAIKCSIKRNVEQNLASFEFGIEEGKKFV